MAPEIKVSPPRSNFVDDLDEFVVTGLDPMNVYRVELVLNHKTKFTSNAFFVSNKRGEIDLSKAAPLFGFYKGVDKMGLFTALYQDPSERFASKLILTPVPDSLVYKISVHVLEDPRSLAEVEIERVIRDEAVVREVLEHDTLEGVVFTPKEKSDAKLPCIIDLSGVGGTKEHRACFLAAQGYHVLALTMYDRNNPKLPKRHESVTSEYIVSAIDYITALPSTTDQVILIGTSLGGTWSFHAATRSPKVKAAISINGQGGYYFVSQIKENGKTLPFVPVTPEAMVNIKIVNGCTSYAAMYGSCKASEQHHIPIEKLEPHQKLYYIASELDEAIPAIQQGEWMEKRMKEVGKETQFRMDVAKKGCHVIDPPFMPICDVVYAEGKFLLFGGDAYVSGCEQRRLWPKLMEFLKENSTEAH